MVTWDPAVLRYPVKTSMIVLNSVTSVAGEYTLVTLSYFNQWGSLGPLMVKTVSTWGYSLCEN